MDHSEVDLENIANTEPVKNTSQLFQSIADAFGYIHFKILIFKG